MRYIYVTNRDMKSETQITPTMKVLELACQKPIGEIVCDALDNSPDRDSAAELLGISRQTLWDWLKRLGMHDSIRGYYRNGDNPANCKEG